MKETSKAMTLRLSGPEHEALVLHAEARRIPIQQIAHAALREYFERHPIDQEMLNAQGDAIMKRYGSVMERLAAT